jgi:hypothetical protein
MVRRGSALASLSLSLLPTIHVAPLREPSTTAPTAEDIALDALRAQSDYDTDDDEATRAEKAARRADLEVDEQMRQDAAEERRQHELSHTTTLELSKALTIADDDRGGAVSHNVASSPFDVGAAAAIEAHARAAAAQAHTTLRDDSVVLHAASHSHAMDDFHAHRDDHHLGEYVGDDGMGFLQTPRGSVSGGGGGGGGDKFGIRSRLGKSPRSKDKNGKNLTPRSLNAAGVAPPIWTSILGGVVNATDVDHVVFSRIIRRLKQLVTEARERVATRDAVAEAAQRKERTRLRKALEKSGEDVAR